MNASFPLIFCTSHFACFEELSKEAFSSALVMVFFVSMEKPHGDQSSSFAPLRAASIASPAMRLNFSSVGSVRWRICSSIEVIPSHLRIMFFTLLLLCVRIKNPDEHTLGTLLLTLQKEHYNISYKIRDGFSVKQ